MGWDEMFGFRELTDDWRRHEEDLKTGIVTVRPVLLKPARRGVQLLHHRTAHHRPTMGKIGTMSI